jgi:flagellar basal-body rod protein FlgC
MLKNIIYIIILTVAFSSICFGVGPGLENALEISTSGLIAQKMRMNIIADNIANIDTIDDGSGEPFKKKVAILRSSEFVRRGGGSGGVLGGVQVVDIQEQQEGFSRVYDPAHPQANQNGYVKYPNVNLTEELVEMTQASSGFEGNVIVFNTTKQMMETALELGR